MMLEFTCIVFILSVRPGSESKNQLSRPNGDELHPHYVWVHENASLIILVFSTH